jgi:sodium-dependent dicarboxylate transporter 2/3/5
MIRYASIFLLAFILATLVYFQVEPYGYPKAIALSVAAFAAILWITEIIPLYITALFIPIGLIGGGVFEPQHAFSSFIHPVIFLMLGGYIIAIAIEKTGVACWITRHILLLSGHHRFSILAAFMLASACMSTLISNTATVALLIPVVVHFLNSTNEDKDLSKALMLGIAYGASIGGVATLVGSPPNAIAAGMLNISFLEWISYGLPVSVTMLIVAFFVLRFSFPMEKSLNINIDEDEALSKEGKRTLIIVGIVLFFWLFGPYLESILNLPEKILSSANVACMAIVILLLFRCLKLSDVKTGVNWGVLILIGGGLTLGQGLIESGASEWLAILMADEISTFHPLLFLAIVVAIGVFATEIISNTAVAANLAPILMGIALQIGVSQGSLVIPVVIATSMAFMLPVATPPNALVHACGYVTQTDMMRIGIRLNVLAIVVIVIIFRLAQF